MESDPSLHCWHPRRLSQVAREDLYQPFTVAAVWRQDLEQRSKTPHRPGGDMLESAQGGAAEALLPRSARGRLLEGRSAVISEVVIHPDD